MRFCIGDLVEVKGYTDYCVVTRAGQWSSNVRHGVNFIYDVPNDYLKPVAKDRPFKEGDRVVHKGRGFSGTIKQVTADGRTALVLKDGGGTSSCYVCNLQHETVNQEKEPTMANPPPCPALTPKEDRLHYHIDEAVRLHDELLAEQAAAEQKKKDDEAAAIKAAAKAAKVEEIKKLKHLLEATAILLRDVEDLVTTSKCTMPSKNLADHLVELQPLANSLGYSIVLVGDNSTAILVQP